MPVGQKTMRKIIALSALLLGVVVLAGCGRQPVSQTQPTMPAPVAQQNTSQQTPKAVVYKNINVGFQLTMPKEWNEYLALYEMDSGSYGTVEFFLPTKDKNWADTLAGNDKEYASLMIVKVWDRNYWNEKLKSKECKETPIECPPESEIIAQNNEYIYTVSGGQDCPSDLCAEPYLIGLNFPTNFQKYFKLELINE